MAAERRTGPAIPARVGAAVALAALCACFVPTTTGEPAGYDPALPSGVLYRWPLGKVVRVYVDPTAAPADELRAATRAAAESWADALYYRELQVALVADVRVADVVVRVAQAPSLVDVAGCAPPLGEPAGATLFCPARLPAPQPDTALTLPLLDGAAGRVKVEVTVDPSQAPAAGGLAALVAHELGHALGIGAHSADARDLMHPAPSTSRPSMRDASTLRWLLHQYADLRL